MGRVDTREDGCATERVRRGRAASLFSLASVFPFISRFPRLVTKTNGPVPQQVILNRSKFWEGEDVGLRFTQ